MRAYEFLRESEEKIIPCPFPNSKIPDILYHGTNVKFDKFLRPVHGIFASPHPDYAGVYSVDHLIAFYANSKNLITLNYRNVDDNDIIDIIYDRNYIELGKIVKNWIQQGYDACYYGGEGESYLLFGNIQIVNAYTGKEM
jgi:hypothetical protein